MFLLRGLRWDLLADELIFSELQCWTSSLKSTRDILGETELSGFRVRAREAAFSQTEVLEESTLSLLSALSSQHVDASDHHI